MSFPSHLVFWAVLDMNEAESGCTGEDVGGREVGRSLEDGDGSSEFTGFEL